MLTRAPGDLPPIVQSAEHGFLSPPFAKGGSMKKLIFACLSSGAPGTTLAHKRRLPTLEQSFTL